MKCPNPDCEGGEVAIRTCNCGVGNCPHVVYHECKTCGGTGEIEDAAEPIQEAEYPDEQDFWDMQADWAYDEWRDRGMTDG